MYKTGWMSTAQNTPSKKKEKKILAAKKMVAKNF